MRALVGIVVLLVCTSCYTPIWMGRVPDSEEDKLHRGMIVFLPRRSIVTYQLTQRERIALGLLAQHDALTARELVTSLELPSVEALQPWLKAPTGLAVSAKRRAYPGNTLFC